MMTKTNAYSLVVILVRLGALYLVIRGLAVLVPVFWSSVRSGGDAWALALGGGTLLVVGGLIWLTADLIAKVALASPREPQFASELDVGQWQYVLFSAAGLWWAIEGLNEVVWTIAHWWQLRAYAGPSAAMMRFGESHLADLVGGIVQFIFGIALLLGGRGLIAILHRLRGL